MRVLVSGAKGFIGSALISFLQKQAIYQVIAATTKNTKVNCSNINNEVTWVDTDAIDPSLLLDVDVIVHLAGRAHRMGEDSDALIDEYRKDNVLLTYELAQKAIAAGVKKFIFLSSILVNGSYSKNKISESSPIRPANGASKTKFEAEQKLRALCAGSTKMNIVIIRAPVVYARNAPGNIGKIIEAIEANKILPLGSINNKRSFIGIDNLVSFIELCIRDQRANNELFLISDGKDISTTEFTKALAAGLTCKPRLIPVPVWVLYLLGVLFRKKALINTLTADLCIDCSKAFTRLGWQPVSTMSQQMKNAQLLR